MQQGHAQVAEREFAARRGEVEAAHAAALRDKDAAAERAAAALRAKTEELVRAAGL